MPRQRLPALQPRRTFRAMTSRSYWTAVWCGFVVLAIGLGVRQSFGIFLVPVSAELHVGRELFSFGTAASMLLMGVFAHIAAARKASGDNQSSRAALAEAFGNRSYVLLMIGYFVCGFHVAFVGGHLPAYVRDQGIGLSLFGVTLSPAELGGWSIGMVGLF